MYSQITANKRKTWILFTSFLVLIIALGFGLSRLGSEFNWVLPVAVIFSVVTSWVSYFYSDKIALSIARAKQIKKSDNPYVYRLVENLAITSGLPCPRVYIIESVALNAFATGRDPKHAAIAVTTGLIERLENEELEGVIAHELAHVKNYDIRLSTMVVTLVGVVALVSDLFLRSLWFTDKDSDNGGVIWLVVAVVASVLAPIGAMLIQLAISRKREFLADADGALLTRYPEGLALALEKIDIDPEQLKSASSAMAHLYIANPLKDKPGKQTGKQKRFLGKLFSTHPPVEERVKALREMTH